MPGLLLLLAIPLGTAVLLGASFVWLDRDHGLVEAGETFNRMAIDLDPSTPGVQNTLFPPVGSTFHVRVALEVLGQGVYTGYQVKLTYDDAVLDAGPPGLPGAMPASWSSAPGATTGGNLLVFANSPSCLPAAGGDALQDNGVATDHSEDDTGTNAILMSCVDSVGASVPGAPPIDWVDFYFRCSAAGDTLMRIENSGTYPLPFVLINGSWNNAFVYCTGSPSGTPTDTPHPTATNTPLPSSTPTAVPPTATPTVLACPGVDTVARSLIIGGGGDVDGDGDVDLTDLKLAIVARQSRAC